MASKIGEVDSLLARLTTPYFSEEVIPGEELDAEFPVVLSATSNNYKLLKTFDDGYWDQIRQNEDDFRVQMFPQTMTEGPLDIYASTFGILRKDGESDAGLRIRIQAEIKRRRGGTHPDSIIQFVENFLQAQEGDVKLFENEDPTTGAQRDAFFFIEFTAELLEDLGFEAPFTDEIEDIEAILDRISAAGVKGEVRLITGDTYDGSSTYDDAVYGT